MTKQGDPTKGDKRRKRSRERTERLLARMFELTQIGSFIQCGLGDWAEGPVLIDKLGYSIPWIAVEPINRYCHDAWKSGFVGPIIQMAVWSCDGEILKLHDWRTRTSVHNSEDRGLGSFETYTMTLDSIVFSIGFEPEKALLWMDTEGCEVEIIRGGSITLEHVNAIICELKTEPKLQGWPNEAEIRSWVEARGFEFICKDGDDGLFVRRKD